MAAIGERVTLIATVNGRNSIWLLADRRLSYKGRGPKDDARKLMFLETVDGVAILGYAGLGATALGTEPADWMSNVLRGRNLPLEQSLMVLADAMRKQFPRHMARMPGPGAPAHAVVATAFLNGEVRVYAIELVFAPDRKDFSFRCTRPVPPGPVARTPQLAFAGSGARHLAQDRQRIRSLLRLVRAYDRDKVSSTAVADYLATLNLEVHKKDGTVGPRCIVAWRNKKGSNKEGGGQWYYTGETRDVAGTDMRCLPTITNGMDVRALAAFLIPRTLDKMHAAMTSGQPVEELDNDQLNAEIRRLPWGPDEDLR